MADEGFEEDMGSAEEGISEAATMVDEAELLEEGEVEASDVAMMRSNYDKDMDGLQNRR